MKARVIKTGNQLDKMVADLMQIDGENVQVGHFAEQGMHSTIGLPYAALMRKHAAGYTWKKPNGQERDVPPRPVLDILGFKLQGFKNPKIRLLLRLWSKMNFSPAATKLMMNEIGKIIAKMEKKIFGDTALLAPNHPLTINKKGFDAPLIETSELRDKVAYKTSLEGVVKEVK